MIQPKPGVDEPGMAPVTAMDVLLSTDPASSACVSINITLIEKIKNAKRSCFYFGKPVFCSFNDKVTSIL